MSWLFSVTVAWSLVNVATHPSSQSLPTDSSDWCKLENSYDSLPVAVMPGRFKEVLLVEDIVEWSGRVTWMGV